MAATGENNDGKVTMALLDQKVTLILAQVEKMSGAWDLHAKEAAVRETNIALNKGKLEGACKKIDELDDDLDKLRDKVNIFGGGNASLAIIGSVIAGLFGK